jgi:hypothetical protein
MIYSGKIKKLKFTSWSVRRGVLSGHLYASGFNGVFCLDDSGKIVFLTEKAAKKALEGEPLCNE